MRLSARSLAATLLLFALWSTAGLAGAGTVQESLTEFAQLPDTGGAEWTRVGTAPALILDGNRLLLNDNTPTDRVAYQTLLGQIQASDRVTVRAQVSVLSNVGGDGALLELSRPGLELVLRLRMGRVDLMERSDTRDMAWLGTVPVDLSVAHEVSLCKEARPAGGGMEEASVEIDGVELLRVRPRGGGNLGVGRVLIGSLSYPGYGASVWSWLDTVVEHPDVAGRVPTESTSMGALKSRWSGTQ